MSATALDKEDIKAAIRKKYGTLRNFASKRGISEQSIADLFRSRSRTAARVIADEMGVKPEHLSFSPSSKKLDHSDHQKLAHRLNAEAR